MQDDCCLSSWCGVAPTSTQLRRQKLKLVHKLDQLSTSPNIPHKRVNADNWWKFW